MSPELREAIRREALAELWRRKEVWPLLEAYLDRDQLADIRAFMEGGDAQAGRLPPEDWWDAISRQRGKSWKWTVFAVTWCHCHPGQFVKYAAQLGKSVRNIIRPTVNRLLADMPREFRAKDEPRSAEAIKEDRQDHKWLFPNGSELMAAGANLGHYEDLRGQKSHLNVNDECGFYDDFDAVQRVLRPQTQTTGGVNVYATTPSESPAHPSVVVRESLKASGRYVHRTIHHHPRMTPEEVEAYLKKEAAAKGLSLSAFRRSTYYKREFLCLEVVEATRAVIPEWSMEAECEAEGLTLGDVLVADLPRQVLYDTYVSTDFGYTVDPHAAVFAEWDGPWARLVVVDELPPMFRTRTDELAAAIREKEHALWPARDEAGRMTPKPFPEAEPEEDGLSWRPYMRVADGGGRGTETIHELAKDHRLTFAPTSKETLEVMVNELRRWVASRKLYVHPRCKHLRKQLATTLWQDRAKADFERNADGHGDLLMALVYLVRNVAEHRNPVPPLWGVDPERHYVTIRGHTSGTTAAVGRLFGGGKR